MIKTRFTLLAPICGLVALCTVLAPASVAEVWLTGPIDRHEFQALVDAASPGDTIACLAGEYRFGGQGPLILDKGLKIKAADPYDMPLFVGDTVDGTVDGEPVGGTPPQTGNTAIVMSPGAAVHDLEFRSLQFTGFERTMVLDLGHDFNAPGCPLLASANFTGLVVEGTHFRKTRRAIQLLGGPLDGFVFKDNTIELSQVPSGLTPIPILLVGGTEFSCPADGTLFELLRPGNGTIKNNRMRGGFVGVWIYGGEQVSVKSNTIEAPIVAGIHVIDDRAVYFGDDGPIQAGEVKGNHISGGLFGILGEGPTTMESVGIKGNVVDGSLVGILLDFGANNFEIKDNSFSNIAAAEIWLGYDETGDPFASPPESHDNSVIAGAGDRVFDFGVDNTIKIE